MSKKALTGIAIIAVLALAGPVGSASAATYQAAFKTKVKAGPQKTTTGTCSGKPFGNGTVTQTQTAEGVYTTTLKAKGGSVTISLRGGPVGNKIKGTWTAVSGTGKFKGISGKGTLESGGVAELIFKGSVKY